MTYNVFGGTLNPTLLLLQVLVLVLELHVLVPGHSFAGRYSEYRRKLGGK